MIDYETYARIRDCRDRQGLTITQIARTLGVHRKTVAKWLARSRFERPRPPPRTSILDPFKGRITRLLDNHPYSAQQIFQRLLEEGYGGGITTLRVYVRRIRPPKLPVYLKLHFAPGGAGRSIGILRYRCGGQNALASLLLHHRACLQPADVRRVHRRADHGAFPRLS